MRRGTTPTLEIEVEGIELSALKEIIVTIRQEDVVIDKEPTVNGNILEVLLTQEETLSLKDTYCKIQMKGQLENGGVVATNIRAVLVSDILNEVML